MTRHFLKSKESAGFTLIEALVAVTIITISIAGPLTAANIAIVTAQMSRDQLTASYLAQEGIEYVRAVRDDTYLANTTNAWSDFLSLSSAAQCRGPGICTLGAALTLIPCSGNSCTGAAPFSLMAGGTPFIRTIQIIDASPTDVRIVSEVSWDFHGTTRTVTVYDHLTPWQ